MSHESIRDLHRVVCVGDQMVARKTGATESLERLCRIEEPAAPWRFWHQGEPSTTARILREEAIWKALGLGAGRIVLSLGHAELQSGQLSPSAIAEEIGSCQALLSAKSSAELWLLLPIPALWPLERRDAALRLREILAAVPDKWHALDVHERADQFLSSQAAHPDLAVALAEDGPLGPVPTATGALLVAREIHRIWTGK